MLYIDSFDFDEYLQSRTSLSAFPLISFNHFAMPSRSVQKWIILHTTNNELTKKLLYHKHSWHLNAQFKWTNFWLNLQQLSPFFFEYMYYYISLWLVKLCNLIIHYWSHGVTQQKSCFEVLLIVLCPQNLGNQSNINIVPTINQVHTENERTMTRRPLETVTCYKVHVKL